MALRTYLCVFCGSSFGADPRFQHAATAAGTALAARGWGLVYGGARVGLMGAVADAALAGSAPVIGVLPAVLRDREVAHRGLTELHFVGSMHERKARMAERAHAFLALPGGFGTLDELCEIVTWAQLGIHRKPVVLLNVQGFFDSLLRFVGEAHKQGFIPSSHASNLLVASDVEEAFRLLQEGLACVSEPEAGAPLP